MNHCSRLATAVIACLFTLSAALAPSPAPAADAQAGQSPFAKDNLVAWCVVPFDAAQRGPEARAEMLQELGIEKLAYDWRARHVPTFEEEIVQMKQHGIEFFAFWGLHEEFLPLVKKHGIRPQFWVTMRGPGNGTQQEKVEAAARRLLPAVEQTDKLGCKLGLYNHGGWGGEPENLVAVTQWLQEHADAEHVGIVYNLHHGHGHIDDFAEVSAAMKPYLLCLNLNGMNDDAQPKILPIGQGEHDAALMKTIKQSGYSGPIGILDHRGDVDTEKALRANLDGMKKVLKQIGDEAAWETY
jgi:sugar phosphate isomerase/epimerase